MCAMNRTKMGLTMSPPGEKLENEVGSKKYQQKSSFPAPSVQHLQAMYKIASGIYKDISLICMKLCIFIYIISYRCPPQVPSFQFLIRYDPGDKIREHEASDQITVFQHFFLIKFLRTMAWLWLVQQRMAQVEEQENGSYLLQFFAQFGDQLPVDTEMKDMLLVLAAWFHISNFLGS